jgi:hypothetical protein
MTSKKNFFALILITLGIPAFSQTKDSTVFLRWKLKPGEVITYKTEMKEIDTANHKDMSMAGFSKALGDSTHDDDFKKVIKQLKDQIQHTNFVTHLTEKRKGIIDIELSAKKDDDKSAKDTAAAMAAMMPDGVMLRGAIDENGSIESFYTKNDQKNLVAIFFELPGKAIKPGDKWPLSVNFLSMDQNFVCDTSYRRNVAILVGVENKNGEHIARIKYDMEEYVSGDFMNTKTTMKMIFQGLAEFSIERGRWVVYDGVMSLSSTGMMISQSTQQLSLIAE